MPLSKQSQSKEKKSLASSKSAGPSSSSLLAHSIKT